MVAAACSLEGVVRLKGVQDGFYVWARRVAGSHVLELLFQGARCDVQDCPVDGVRLAGYRAGFDQGMQCSQWDGGFAF